MIALILGFGKKYLIEILMVVGALILLGGVVYKAQNWCNHACREARVERDEAKAALKTCQDKSEAEMAHYLNERATWQKQVDEQAAAVKTAKEAKAKIVDTNRRKFDEIFTERKKNERKSQERIVAQVKPTAVVVAPVAIMREYNEAIANGASTATGGRSPEVGLSNDSAVLAGEVATFDAVAVAEAVVGNIHKYNELALRCDTLIDIVKELEAKNGNANDGRTAGAPAGDGGDVPDGTARAAVN